MVWDRPPKYACSELFHTVVDESAKLYGLVEWEYYLVVKVFQAVHER